VNRAEPYSVLGPGDQKRPSRGKGTIGADVDSRGLSANEFVDDARSSHGFVAEPKPIVRCPAVGDHRLGDPGVVEGQYLSELNWPGVRCGCKSN
jgi:hypothetical protein